jgi:hypothetical protein
MVSIELKSKGIDDATLDEAGCSAYVVRRE